MSLLYAVVKLVKFIVFFHLVNYCFLLFLVRLHNIVQIVHVTNNILCTLLYTI